MGEPTKEGEALSTPLRHTPVIQLESRPHHGGSKLHRFSFAGRLIVEHEEIRSGLVYGILKSAWSPKGGMELHEQSKHTYVFILSNEEEKQRIFNSSPWFVKGHHLLLTDWPASQRFDELHFSTTEFWVQVHGLSKAAMTEENARRIGSLFPRLISWDSSTLGGLESFMRLRVEIDIHQPLLTGFQIDSSDEQMKLAKFRYEKLADFCYQCGMLGQTIKTCEDSHWTDEAGNYTSQARSVYGPLLRASAYSPRRHFGALHVNPQQPKPPHKQVAFTEITNNNTQMTISPEINTEERQRIASSESKAARAHQLVTNRVISTSQEPSSLSFNETGPQVSEDLNRCPSQSKKTSLHSSEPTPPRAAPLNVKGTTQNSPEASSHTQPLHTGSHASSPMYYPGQLGSPEEQINSLQVGSIEAGSILSEQIRTQLNLGEESNQGKKRRLAETRREEELKRLRTQACAEGEPACSPTQLQETFLYGRPVFDPKELPHFFTVEESIMVQKVRRKIRLKAPHRQVRAGPDRRLALQQPFHSTQKQTEEPPFEPMIMVVDPAPIDPVATLFVPSNSSEQPQQRAHDIGASMAGPWQPPPPP
ncbi:hypothetical protein SLA2020_197050 [Shorea laevis]